MERYSAEMTAQRMEAPLAERSERSSAESSVERWGAQRAMLSAVRREENSAAQTVRLTATCLASR